MPTNLGIIASSLSGSRAPTTFNYGGTVLPSNVGRLAFINGTAVLARGGASSAHVETWYSADVWTGATAGANSINTPNGLYADNGVAVKFGRGVAGTVAVARSTDGGQTWATALNTAATSDLLYAGAYGNVGGTARWISPVNGDNDVYLSTNNGSSWTIQSNVLGGTARSWIAATRFGSAFGVFRDATDYYTSETGVTWTLRTLPVAPGHASFRNFVAGSAEVMYTVTLGTAGVATYTSTDLVNWTTTGTVAFSNSINNDLLHIAYGNGYYVIMAGRDDGSDTTEIAYSASAGTNWTIGSVTSGTQGFISLNRDFAYNPTDGGFYIVAGARIWRAITI